jgi:Zn-dependent peptidase ImmA (M78 family)
MNHSLELLKKKIPGFNRRRQTETDFWKLIKRERIIFVTWPFRKGGYAFYGVNRKGRRVYRFIAMDEQLFRSGEWLQTAFHELIHHFLHVPSSKLKVYWSKSGEQGRHDRQADMFALVMRIPLPDFLELAGTPFSEITGFTKKELIERKKIYETYGY